MFDRCNEATQEYPFDRYCFSKVIIVYYIISSATFRRFRTELGSLGLT